MKSATLPSFWEAYKDLDETIRRNARKAYHLWVENPFHPSLHFKFINRQEDIWSVRITPELSRRGYFRGRFSDVVLDWQPR